MDYLKFKPATFVLVIILLAIALTSKPATAEIATVKDWIGFFDTTAGDGKTAAYSTTDPKFIDGHLWAYTNSNCTLTPQTAGTTPSLSNPSGCDITPNPLPESGTYEYRMYAYDGQNSEALIAKSIAINPAPSAEPGSGTGPICPSQAANPPGQDGLISAPYGSEKFGNPGGTCAIDQGKAAFAPYKIPSYDDLKSIYYTQSKAYKTTPISGDADQNDLTISQNSAFYISGDLGFSGNPAGSSTGVIFVDGSLYIAADLTYGTNTSGLVFVVKGNVMIDKSVKLINAVIISDNTVYTAVDLLANPPVTTCIKNNIDVGASTNALTINGSLISLKEGSIVFCRKLTDDFLWPAEKINQEPKYLVILKDLFSDTLQKWSEIQ